MNVRLKELGAWALYRFGILQTYHRLRNRDTLTVAMFHRVLPHDDSRRGTALPTWTVTPDELDLCLSFFRKHYNVVSLSQVLAAAQDLSALPQRSLLITFDDGYADIRDHALPVLRHHGMPAALFIFSDGVGADERPWTEHLLWSWQAGCIEENAVLGLLELLVCGGLPDAPRDGGAEMILWHIARSGSQLPEGLAQEALAAMGIRFVPHADRLMIDGDGLRALQEAGVEIGSHGKTHAALPLAVDLHAELTEPRRLIAELGGCGVSMNAMSFPHGEYTPAIIDAAHRVGYRLLFTTDGLITKLHKGRPATTLMARINADPRRFVRHGLGRPEKLATLFFLPDHTSSDPARTV